MGYAGAGREEGLGGDPMSEEMRLVDADELRRRLEEEFAQNAPKGWTRDEVLAELAKHPDNVCEHLDYYTGKWTPSVAVTGWGNPDVPRTNVRVVRSTPDPEWVPLTKLVGRTIHGCDWPVGDWHPPSAHGLAWRWYVGGGEWRAFPDGTLNLDTGMVAVRPEAAT